MVVVLPLESVVVVGTFVADCDRVPELLPSCKYHCTPYCRLLSRLTSLMTASISTSSGGTSRWRRASSIRA